MSSASTAQYINYVSNQYGYYTCIVNLILGFISNIFIILIFTNLKIFLCNQCSFYLTVEAFSNIGLLVAVCSSRMLNKALGYDPVSVSVAWCKIRMMLIETFGLCSLFTICCTAFDQYLATHHRYSFRHMSTLKLAYYFIISNVCFSVLHSTVFLVFYDIQKSMGCSVYNPIMKKYYSYFYYPILSTALPLVITVSMSLLAYYNVRRIVRRQINVIRRRLDHQLTAMVLARVICLIVLGLPFICTVLYQLNHDNSQDNNIQSAMSNLIGIIFYSLLYTNFSVN